MLVIDREIVLEDLALSSECVKRNRKKIVEVQRKGKTLIKMAMFISLFPAVGCTDV